MNQMEPHSAFFMTGVGQRRAVFGPPANPVERRTWRKWLGAVGAAIVLSSAAALFWITTGTVPPLEATVQMERLAAKVEHAKSIHPDTAREIAKLIGQPGYDCNQVACSAPLQARNSAVRNRLQTLMATKTPASSFAGGNGAPPVGADATTTGSTTGAGPE